MKALNQKGGYCDHGTLGNVSVRSFVYGDVYGEFGDEEFPSV